MRRRVLYSINAGSPTWTYVGIIGGGTVLFRSASASSMVTRQAAARLLRMHRRLGSTIQRMYL